MAFTSRSTRRWGISAAALALAAPALAAAQSASAPVQDQPQEIVVTARQRTESLKDVPAEVSVLTGKVVQAAGVARVEGFVNLIPGVSVVNGAAEQGDTQVNIRGINSARDAEPSFAFVLDGIQISDPSTFNREYSDLQQIEVVKGPQGAIYGRNAEAGAMIITTDKPTSYLTASIDASAATYGLYTVKGLISGPLTSTINGSLSADFRNNDGEFKNSLFSGQSNLDSFEGGNLNARAIWTPDGKTRVDAKLRYGQSTGGSINYNSIFELPLFASVLNTPAFYQNPNEHQFVYQNNVPNSNNQETFETSVKVDHDYGWATLTAWGLFSDSRNDILADGTSGAFGFFNNAPLCQASVASLYAQGVKLPSPTYLGPTPAQSLLGAYTPSTCDGYQYQLRKETDESFEVRLTSPSHEALRWLAGAYYLHSDHPVGVATGTDSGGNPPRSLYVPSNQPYDTEQLLYDDFSSNVGAVFGQVQYDFQKGLEGSFALRYDNEDRHDHNLVPTNDLTNYIEYSGPPYTGGAPLNPALDPALNPDGVHDRDKDFDQIEPKVGLRWAATPEWTVYGDWGIGFKSGGFNNQGSAATINTFINPIRTSAGYAPVDISDQYKKETSSETELGAKGQLLNGKLTVDASVYDDVVDNSQFFEFFVGPFGLLRVVSNIDRVHLDGAELGLNFKVTPELTLSASGAYTYSRIEKNSVRPDTVGNESPYTPEYTWNFAAQYDKPWIMSSMLHARVDVRGTGPTWFSDVQKQSEPSIFYALYGPLGIANYSQTERQAYTLVNLRIGVSKDRWTVTLFADNLFDTRYLNEIIPAPEFGGVFASPAEGGRYGIETSYKF